MLPAVGKTDGGSRASAGRPSGMGRPAAGLTRLALHDSTGPAPRDTLESSRRPM